MLALDSFRDIAEVIRTQPNVQFQVSLLGSGLIDTQAEIPAVGIQSAGVTVVADQAKQYPLAFYSTAPVSKSDRTQACAVRSKSIFIICASTVAHHISHWHNQPNTHIMSNTAHETAIEEMLADGSDLLVKVVLTGPRWVSGDITAKYPSLDVSVIRIEVREISASSTGLSSIAESPDREPSARSRESDGSINANLEDEYRDVSSESEDEQRFDSDQLCKLLSRQLERENAGSYKTWAKGSDSLKGGCCPHHRDQLETFLETTTYDVVRNMMWIEEDRRSERRERPEWLRFQASGQAGDSAEIDKGYTTTKPGSDLRVSDFPWEYTTAGGSLWDDRVVQSAVGRNNCQFPLSELLQKGVLGLDIEASMKTPAPLFTDLRAKWTIREGSLDITTPEMVNQLRYLEPISTAYINEVKKEVSYMRGWSKETHRTNLEFAMTTAKGTKNPSQSHWQVPYPFSGLRPKLVIVEREGRSRSSK